ncbi:MAG: hypothetical protein NZ700_07155 [Gemmataceae bacterium]|nr:hypothetical protein [Gemmataceae bacterium]MDW8263966.1 hypothetical protein [Gemmataceae bacterium]
MSGWRCLVSGWVVVWSLTRVPAVVAQEAWMLREPFPVGHRYHVSVRVELSGTVTVPSTEEKAPAKTLTVSGSSTIEYDERVLALTEDGTVRKTARIYRQIDFRRQIGSEQQRSTIRPEVRRLVVLRHQHVEVPFSPDGPLTWGEIDLVRTDVFTPALVGLFADRPVRPGDRWNAATPVVHELTDIDRIDDGQLSCRFDEISLVGSRRLARVCFTGSIRGTNEDGPNRQDLDGYCYFDLEARHLSYLFIRGFHYLLDKDGKETGRVEGRFVLTRQIAARGPGLDDADLQGMAQEPTSDNTLLLYDNPALGVRFLHPRRWRVGVVRGRQITVEEAHGSSLLITLDRPDKVPTAAQFLADSREWFAQQKPAGSWKAGAPTGPHRLSGPPRELDHFSFEVESPQGRALMDYYVVHQQPGGALIAARLAPADATALQADVAQMARSLTINRPLADK